MYQYNVPDKIIDVSEKLDESDTIIDEDYTIIDEDYTIIDDEYIILWQMINTIQIKSDLFYLKLTGSTFWRNNIEIN